jgi:hypothetical protein
MRPPTTSATASLAGTRQGSMAVLVLLVVEYGLGMYVNLYVALPRADHSHSVERAVANGPAILSAHAVIGLLLGLGALGVLAQAAMARHRGAISASGGGLLAVAIAAAAGASFTSTGEPSDSMAMSVLTGVALLCYAANLFMLPKRGQPSNGLGWL